MLLPPAPPAFGGGPVQLAPPLPGAVWTARLGPGPVDRNAGLGNVLAADYALNGSHGFVP